MSVVDGMLRLLIGEEAAQKIIDHPELHVIKLPAHMVDDLVEGTVMVVPVGILCDLCDLPAANKFCQCQTETFTDDAGFSMTIKYRDEDDRVRQLRNLPEWSDYTNPSRKPKVDHRGVVVPPVRERRDDRELLRPAPLGYYPPEQPWAVLGGDQPERGDVQDADVPSVQGRCVDPGTESSGSVGEAPYRSEGVQDCGPAPDAGGYGGSSDSGSSYDSGSSGGGWSE